jgi:peroxiredoxin
VDVGEKAPTFELPSTQGGTIRLADFAGKKEVVLLFYPMDFTPT